MVIDPNSPCLTGRDGRKAGDVDGTIDRGALKHPLVLVLAELDFADKALVVELGFLVEDAEGCVVSVRAGNCELGAVRDIGLLVELQRGFRPPVGASKAVLSLALEIVGRRNLEL